MGMDPRTNPHPRVGTGGEAERSTAGKPKPPTVRQVYALAAALCEKHGEQFPETRADASQLIERLRDETGHPSPRLEDSPSAQASRPRRRR
jgi:hypothetical protein